MTAYLVHATGLAALTFNVFGLIRTSDRSLRHATGWASALWAANNLLMGAQSAAALSALSVGRQATASAVQAHSERTKFLTCATFLVVTFAVGVLTWNGMATLFTTVGSLLATYAMFYMRGAWLRVAMVGVAALWMYNAWAYDSWWQMFGNAINGGAAAYGAWRSARACAADPAQCP